MGSHPVLTCSNLSCPNLTCLDLTCLDLTCPDLKCPDLTCSNLTCSNLTCYDLSYPDLTCPNMTCTHSWHSSSTFQQTPFRHLSETRHNPDTFQTLTRHLGPSLLVKVSLGSIISLKNNAAFKSLDKNIKTS